MLPCEDQDDLNLEKESMLIFYKRRFFADTTSETLSETPMHCLTIFSSLGPSCIRSIILCDKCKHGLNFFSRNNQITMTNH